MNDAIAAPAAPVGGSIMDNLTAAFAAAEAPIDNLQPETEVTPEVIPEAPAEVAEPEKVAEGEPETTPEGEESDEPTGDTPDFLSPEQIEEKYKLSNTKGLRALTSQYSVIAKEATEKVNTMLTQLGGEPFVEPMSRIATALKSVEKARTNPQAFAQPFFEGIVDAAGDEAFEVVLEQAVHLAFVQGQSWIDNPATAEFGKGLEKMVNESVEKRFGTTIDRLTKSAEWDKVGWPDKLQSWVDRYEAKTDDTEAQVMSEVWDELEEMLQVNTNPKLKALAEENTALKRQRETPGNEAKPQVRDTSDENYNEYASLAVSTVLDQVMWKNSPLRDIDTDTAEMKEVKGYLRDSLANKSLQALQSNAARQKLAAGFRDGKQQTAVYQTVFTTAIDEALQKTANERLVAEKILTSLYGKTRNAKLAAPPVTNGNTPPPPQAPTVPTNFAPPAGQVLTQDQILKNLEQGFINHESRK